MLGRYLCVKHCVVMVNIESIWCVCVYMVDGCGYKYFKCILCPLCEQIVLIVCTCIC